LNNSLSKWVPLSTMRFLGTPKHNMICCQNFFWQTARLL
jgi:hypothetical protein